MEGVDAWSLFDNDPSTRLPLTNGGCRLRLQFERPERFEAAAFYGARNVTASIQSEVDGRPEAIRGLTDVALGSGSGARQHVSAAAPVDTATLLVDLRADAADASAGEIELWGLRVPPPFHAGETLADQILAGTIRADLDVAATPARLTVSAPALARGPTASDAVVRIDAEPRLFSHVFLVYELAGLPHWSATVRQINGTSLVGGFGAVAGAQGGLQVEEIDARWLQRGENRIRFAPTDRADAVGYRVSNLRIIGVSSDGVTPELGTMTDGDGAADLLRELTDGQLSTGGTGHARRNHATATTWSFDGPSEVTDLTFRLTQPFAGAIELSAGEPRSARHRVSLDGRTAGWHRVSIVGALPATDRVRIDIRASGEQVGLVSELYVSASRVPSPRQPRLIVTYPTHGECLERQVYVRGFVQDASLAGAQLLIDGRAVDAGLGADGALGVAVPVPPRGRRGARRIDVAVMLADGTRLARAVEVETCSELPAPGRAPGNLVEDTGAPFGAWVRASTSTTLRFGGATIEIPAGAVERDTRVTVRPLVPSQVATMDQGMVNVTPGERGYRFGPHGLRFRQPIRVTVPVDSTRLPAGMTESDVQTFYYDELAHRWRPIQRTRADGTGLVASLTNHFTDFVAATLAAPESPAAAGFTPTSISSLQAADPAAGVTQFEPPAANSRGSANLSFPIQVPPGRAGLQPSLAITYDSEHRNGWLGVGWNVATSAIEIETRFGVPDYNGSVSYVLDGEALTLVGANPSLGGDVFRRRVEGRFDRIVRQGTGPTTYSWEVTDRNGTVFTYGPTFETRLVDPHTPTSANIFRWYLARVRDRSGNTMTFEYERIVDTTTDEPWVEMYPRAIQYTGFAGSGAPAEPGPYRVEFVLASGRPDVVSTARSGFDVRTTRRLERIDVRYTGQLVRSYRLTYRAGDFNKSLLARIALAAPTASAPGGAELYHHDFDYYTTPLETRAVPNCDPDFGSCDTETVTGYPFEPPRVWGRTNNRALGEARVNGVGIAGDVGVGLCGVFNVGATLNAGLAFEDTDHAFLDVNGDGLPDVLANANNTPGSPSIWLNQLSLPGGVPTGAFTEHALEATAPGLIQEAQVNFGASIGLTFLSGLGGTVGGQISGSLNKQYAVTTDVDGDGRPDLVRIGDWAQALLGSSDRLDVWRNPFSEHPVARYFGDFRGGEYTWDYQIGGYQAPNTALSVTPETEARLAPWMHRTDPLLRWTAPLAGTVRLTNRIALPATTDPAADGVHAWIYRVTGSYGSTPSVLWEGDIAPGAHCVPAPSGGCDDLSPGLSVAVAQGDRVYFRVHGRANLRGDETTWAPVIDYVSTSGPAPPAGSMIGSINNELIVYDRVDTGADPRGLTHFAWADDFNIADPNTTSWTANATGRVKVTGRLDLPPLQGNPRGLWSSAGVAIYRRHLDWTPPPGPLTAEQTVDLARMLLASPPPVRWDFMANDPTHRCYAYFSNLSVNNSVDINCEFDVTEGDAVYVSTLVPGLDHPDVIQWTNLHVQYAALDVPQPSGPPLRRTVVSCDAARSVCQLDGTARPSEVPLAMVTRRAAPAIGPTLVSGPFSGATSDPMRGWYHNWSVGEWNGGREGEPATTFNEALVAIPTATQLDAQLARFRLDAQLDPAAFALMEGRLTAPGADRPATNDPNLPAWAFPATTSLPAPAWYGSDPESYIARTTMRPARVGGAWIDPATRNVQFRDERAAYISRAPGLRAASSLSGGFSAGLRIVGGGIATGASDSSLDFFDFNGDGMADSVQSERIQLQTRRIDGGIERHELNQDVLANPYGVASLPVRHSVFDTVRGNVNIPLGRLGLELASRNVQSRLKNFAPMGAGYGVTSTFSRVDIDYVDINGDGLPDYVRGLVDAGGPYLSVRLNLGRRLGRTVQIRRPSRSGLPSCPGLCSGGNPQQSLRAEQVSSQGGSLSGGWGPVIASAGATITQQDVYSQLVDFNGDGLPDQVTRRPGTPAFVVHLNRGDGTFETTPINWIVTSPWELPGSTTRLLDPAHDAVTHSYSVNTNIEGGARAELGFLVCAALGAMASGDHGDSFAQLDLRDIDGDGRLDHVLKKDGDPNFYVRLQPNRRSNLLRTVTQALGGSFELEYAREGNRVGTSTEAEPAQRTRADMPNNRWVLSRLTVRDGRQAGGPLPADPIAGAVHTHAQTFQYFGSGYYDREEREDYGFAHVRTIREDGSWVDQLFHNQDYYLRGRLRQVAEADATGHLYRAEEVVYAEPPPGLPRRTGSFFPAEALRRGLWFDGTTAYATPLPAPRMASATRRRYDAAGNLVGVWDEGGPGPEDDVVSIVQYWPGGTANHVFRPQQVDSYAYSPSGTMSCDPLTDPACRGDRLRGRLATYRSSDGALVSLSHWLRGGTDPDSGAVYDGVTNANPTWHFTYDPYGNLETVRDLTITDPTRWNLRYIYDLATHTYRTRTDDAFGYHSLATYDPRLGVATEVTDINGQRQQVRYDEFGRVTEVYGPYDIGSSEPTIAHDYALQPGAAPLLPLWGRTRHKDRHPSDPIVTVRFLDGLARVIQTKRDAEVDNGSGVPVTGMIVSGSALYDARGRVSREGQPVFDTGLATDFVIVPERNPTSRQYDVLSRVVDVALPDGKHVRTAYAYEEIAGVMLTRSTVTDELDRQQRSWADVRGNTRYVAQYNTIAGALRELVTHYRYDRLGQLLEVEDAKGHVTRAWYDSLGQMVALDNPDAGRTDYLYTVAGDLGARQTPNLRHAGAGVRIGYVYEHHRLARINYPTSAPVVLTYGAPTAVDNSRGRLTTRTDGSGIETLSYGRLGEVIRTEQTLIGAGGIAAQTAVMSFGYDSFGRIQRVTYPDSDEVDYYYDAGGQLRNVASTVFGTHVERVTYDVFGQRASIRYGNGVETRYRRDPAMQRLSNVDTTGTGAVALQRLEYRYNAAGNITEVHNLVPTPTGIGGRVDQVLDYDRLDQLTYAAGTYQSASGSTHTYTLSVEYDEIGNIRQNLQNSAINGSPHVPTSHSFLYGYLGGRPHAPSHVGARTISYDFDGNQRTWNDASTGATRTLDWDEEDRLRRVSGDVAVEFLYDADGQRTHRVSDTGSAVTMYFGAYYSLRNGKIATKSVFAGGERLGSTVGSIHDPSSTHQRFFYHSDHLHSTHYVTNGAGSAEEHVEYLPFGETWVEETSAGAPVPDYRFTGHELDRETGLYYAGARYYDPRQAQWISADPALDAYMDGGPNGGVFTPINLTLYGYAWNRPLVMHDPDGRTPAWLVTVGRYAGGAAVGAALGAGLHVAGCVIDGRPVTREGVRAHAAGGALTGAILVGTGNPASARAAAGFAGIAGVAGGAVTRGAEGGHDNVSNVVGVVADAVVGSVSGYVITRFAQHFAPPPAWRVIPPQRPTFLNRGHPRPGSVVGTLVRRSEYQYALSNGRAPSPGTYDFVVQNGEIRIGSGHYALAGGQPVEWAGTISFGPGGMISRWTNQSGHYRCTSVVAEDVARAAGLPYRGVFHALEAPQYSHPAQVPVYRDPVAPVAPRE